MSDLTAAPTAAPPGGTRRRPRERRPRWQRTIGYLCLVIAVLLSGGLGYGIYEYRHLDSQIIHPKIPVSEFNPKQRQPVIGAQNWLIMGSDSRDCKHCSQYGKALVDGGARSDTTILAHLSRGGDSATLVSIPRDSWVQIPSCKLSNGQTTSPTIGKFNEAFSLGGPGCTIKTVQELTHVPIQHYVVVNFDNFTNIVNALGGVRVCLSQPIDDPIVNTGDGYHGSGLVLSAGYHLLRGQQALKFVRARYAVGDGSDLTRIKDQQAFISATVRKIADVGLLFHPARLISVLDAAVKSLATDVHLGKLADFAESLHGLPPSKVNLLTVPIEYDAPGVPTADVAWDPTLAPELWNSIRNDQPLPGTVSHHKSKRPTTSPSPSTSPSGNGLTVPPGDITVNVLNGTTQNQLAHTVATRLEALGFHIGQIGNTTSPASSTYVEYGPSRVQSSQTLAAAVDSGAPRQLDSSMGDTVTLVLGPDFTGVHAVTVTPQSSTPTPTTPSPTSTASLGIVNAARYKCAVG